MESKRSAVLFKRMLYTIVTIDSRPLESSLAVAALALGTWLALPLNTFGSSSAFNTMRTIASEDVWGVFLSIVGIANLIAVHLNRVRLRKIVNLIALIVWLFVDISIWLAGSESSAASVYFVFVLMAVWSNIALSAKRAPSQWITSINRL